MNSPVIKEIVQVIKDNNKVKTILFDYTEDIKPGQFFMIWIPGVDEIPMSVSYISKVTKGFTFRDVGEATNALLNLKIGDKIGIRGPYGNGFRIKGKKMLFIGGGTGLATLAPAIEEAIDKNIFSTLLVGMKNRDELFFIDRFKKRNIEFLISTDDGSEGFKGLVSDLTKKIYDKNKFDSVLTCGPEIMMKKLYDICIKSNFQASLERFMKCGVGICSQCCVGDGLRLCIEGPVLDGEILKNIEDFGIFKRNSSGRRIFF